MKTKNKKIKDTNKLPNIFEKVSTAPNLSIYYQS